MAAPSTTVWGNIVTESTSAAKIGIYTALSSTNTQTTVTIQVWIASKWSLLDSNYGLYFNNNATSATTAISSDLLPQINVTVATGTGWSDANQVLLYTHTVTYNRSTSAQTINCAAKLNEIDRFSGKTMTVTSAYTIPALISYTISYVANGGSGAPSAQVKWYGINATLSSTKPTRTGYTFLGWSTSSTATSATYAAGGTFTANANTNLYAVWKANTYTVSYNANGGSGAPSSQTKTYGVTLTLSTTIPTRTNYNFLGWGTAASSTTVSYSAGGSYTVNSAITLYAVWELAYKKPRINNLSVCRADSSGNAIDTGTYYNMYFDWETDLSVTSSTIQIWKSSDNTLVGEASLGCSGTSGTINAAGWGSGKLSTEYTYDITVIISDSNGSTTVSIALLGLAYMIDFLNGGNGVAIGKPAELSGYFDVSYNSRFRSNVYLDKGIKSSGYQPINATDDDTVEQWVSLGNQTMWSYSTSGCLLNQPSQWGFLFNLTEWNDVIQLWFTCGGPIYYRSGNANGWHNNWTELVDSSGGTTINSYLVLKNTTSRQLYLDNPLTGTYLNTAMTLRSGGSDCWSIINRGIDGDNQFIIYDHTTDVWAISITPNYGDVRFEYPILAQSYTRLNNSVNTVGYYRFHTEWIGCYSSSANAQNQANRKGWFGFNATSNFIIKNESGGSNITSVAWTTSSDKRMKEDIKDIPDTFVDIWKELQPKVFKWNKLNSSNEKYHFGLIAQDVITAFEKYELDYTEYGFVNSFTLSDDNTEYFGIAYDEYHMLTSLVVRKQQERIDSLEERIKKLEELILGQEE